MTDYTPTTEQVRSIFAGNGDWEHRGTAQEREFEFDRWLADHDALIRAEVIDWFNEWGDRVPTLLARQHFGLTQ